MGNKYTVIAFDGVNGWNVMGWVTEEEIVAKVGPLKTLTHKELGGTSVLELKDTDVLAVPQNVAEHYEFTSGEYENNIFNQVQDLKKRDQLMGEGIGDSASDQTVNIKGWKPKPLGNERKPDEFSAKLAKLGKPKTYPFSSREEINSRAKVQKQSVDATPTIEKPRSEFEKRLDKIQIH